MGSNHNISLDEALCCALCCLLVLCFSSHPLWVSLHYNSWLCFMLPDFSSGVEPSRSLSQLSARHVATRLEDTGGLSQSCLHEERFYIKRNPPVCDALWLCWSFVKSEKVQDHHSDVIRAISAWGHALQIYNRLKLGVCQAEHYGKCSCFSLLQAP